MCFFDTYANLFWKLQSWPVRLRLVVFFCGVIVKNGIVLMWYINGKEIACRCSLNPSEDTSKFPASGQVTVSVGSSCRYKCRTPDSVCLMCHEKCWYYLFAWFTLYDFLLITRFKDTDYSDARIDQPANHNKPHLYTFFWILQKTV